MIHGKDSSGDGIFICCILYVVSAFAYLFNLGNSQLANVNSFDLLFWQIQVLCGFNVYGFKTDFFFWEPWPLVSKRTPHSSFLRGTKLIIPGKASPFSWNRLSFRSQFKLFWANPECRLTSEYCKWDLYLQYFRLLPAVLNGKKYQLVSGSALLFLTEHRCQNNW